MHATCQAFVVDALHEADVKGKQVLEVGAQDVNGSVRDHISAMEPESYVGVDIAAGPGVDRVCRAEDLVTTFGEDAFDLVITTEMLEHVADWRTVIHNLKAVLRPGGVLVITTRSPGFAIHAFPVDCWRYTADDMSTIFSDFNIEALTKDQPADPGIFVRARKPKMWTEANLSSMRLYSIARRRRALAFTRADEQVVQAVTKVQQRLPYDVTLVARFAGNLLGRFSADRLAAGADLTSNMHQPA